MVPSRSLIPKLRVETFAQLAQIGLFFLALVGYFWTVRPAYRLERAEEELARRASDLDIVEASITQQESKLAQLTYLQKLSEQREMALGFRMQDLHVEQDRLQKENVTLQRQNSATRQQNATLLQEKAQLVAYNEELQQRNAEIRSSYEQRLSLEKTRDAQLAQFGRETRDCLMTSSSKSPRSILTSCVKIGSDNFLTLEDQNLAQAWTTEQATLMSDQIDAASKEEIRLVAAELAGISEIQHNCAPLGASTGDSETPAENNFRQITGYVPCLVVKRIGSRMSGLISSQNTVNRAFSLVETAVALRLDPRFPFPGTPRAPESLTVE